ncbi:hypothetical protein FHR56_002686 [Xanthomonas sacchari]|uniref:hypothetical protein n=1 Tax=Xanthomonas sp. LMG 8989 TaxID=1591156 RepID=UPI0013699D62|nr:hypothetical protein [Xanthomonas sp. LMG 8989]MBB6367521.1 hypothetical protein [Xanthomonas sp. F10]
MAPLDPTPDQAASDAQSGAALKPQCSKSGDWGIGIGDWGLGIGKSGYLVPILFRSAARTKKPRGRAVLRGFKTPDSALAKPQSRFPAFQQPNG